MGQIGDKCNCFKDKSDPNTYNFEEESNRQPMQPQSSKQFNAHEFLSKRAKSGMSFDMSSTELKYPELKDSLKIHSFVKLQTAIKAFLYRKKFELVYKKQLIQETYNLLEKYTQELRTNILFKAESYKNTSYDPNGWKKFYPNEEKMFSYNFGRVFNTKLLIYNDGLSIYSGQVNIKNNKHGFGVLLTKEGMKYEGAWINNKFTCWGRFIDSEGNIYNGK